MCSQGFLAAVSDCRCVTKEIGNSFTTRIIPEMSFTCSGTVTHWRAAGVFRDGANANRNSVLSIWRERSSGSGVYNISQRIDLGRCGSEVQPTLVMGMSSVYECTLLQSERVSVQPGDIVGIELAAQDRAIFRLHFDGRGGPTNYIFNRNSPRTVTLNQNNGTESAQPQILLTVERTTEVVPTTQPLATNSPTNEAPVSTEINTSSTLTMISESSTTTVDSTQSDNASNRQENENNNIIAISIAIVGGIVVVLLFFIVVLLLIFVLRWQKSGQKCSSVPVNHSGNNLNSIYCYNGIRKLQSCNNCTIHNTFKLSA